MMGAPHLVAAWSASLKRSHAMASRLPTGPAWPLPGSRDLLEEKLDEALRQTFPASDPFVVT